MSFLFSWRGASLAVAIATMATAAACSSEAIPVDGGAPPSDGATMPTALLEPVSDDNITLVFGEEQTLRVLYREADGRPISAAEVEFALVGRANDSSLSELAADTDTGGQASIRVMAGISASAFSVRVSAPRAAPILIGVSVSDAGFGRLDVSVDRTGTRPVTSHRLGIYTGMTCDDEDVLAGDADRMRNLPVDEEVATFLALPAGLVYAITAAGVGDSGETLAAGCIDNVVVVADEITEAAVPVTDLALAADGDFSIQVALDGAIEADAISRAISRGGRAPIEGAGGNATFLLDALEQSLRDGGDEVNANLIAGERATAFLDDALETRLVGAGVGPSRAVDALAADLAERVATITVEGRIRFSATDPAFIVDGVFGAAADTSLADLFVSAGLFPRPLTGRLAFTPMLAEDLLVLDELGADLPLGSFARGALASLAVEGGAADITGVFEARGGCSEMVLWAAETPVISTACNDTCVALMCQETLAGLAVAVDVEVGNLDLFRSDLALTGTVTATDDTGDLRIDRFSADALVGRYSNADGTEYDEVTASVAGASIIE